MRCALDNPDVICLMLTSFSDDEALFDAVMAGAAGYLLKQVRENDLVGGGAHRCGRRVAARACRDPEHAEPSADRQ